MTDQELQDKYLGKKIQIPWKHPLGFEPNTLVGICEYIGHNPKFPSWGLQITIGRLPVQHVDFNQIKLLEDDKGGNKDQTG